MNAVNTMIAASELGSSVLSSTEASAIKSNIANDNWAQAMESIDSDGKARQKEANALMTAGNEQHNRE